MNETNENIHLDCKMQTAWGKQYEKNKRYESHINEGDKEGGFRDRVAKLEIEMIIFKGAGKWFMLAAFVGGLLSNAIPGLANFLMSHLIR